MVLMLLATKGRDGCILAWVTAEQTKSLGQGSVWNDVNTSAFYAHQYI